MTPAAAVTPPIIAPLLTVPRLESDLLAEPPDSSGTIDVLTGQSVPFRKNLVNLTHFKAKSANIAP